MTYKMNFKLENVPSRTPMQVPVIEEYILAVESALAVTIFEPIALKLTSKTSSVCPVKV